MEEENAAVVKNEDREAMGWLYDMKASDVHKTLTARNSSGEDIPIALVYEHCGLDVLVSLWQNLPGISIYISEKALNDLRKLYVRQNYKPEDPLKGVKVLAATLRVSEQFVRDALPKQNSIKPTEEEKRTCHTTQ